MNTFINAIKVTKKLKLDMEVCCKKE